MNRREFKRLQEQAVKTFADPQVQQEYVDQIREMGRRAKAWKEKNPHRVAQVQFNYSRKIFLVAPISEAVKEHIVSCNEAGLEMVKAMWPWDVKSEPTVTMIKIALEL